MRTTKLLEPSVLAGQSSSLAAKTLVCLLTLEVLSGSLCGPAFANQQASRPSEAATFKVEVNLVNLTVTVTDGAGRPVPDLRKSDFTIYEDGHLQDVAVFRVDKDVPISVGIVVDTSGSMVDKLAEVKDAVLHFADTVNPEDDIFVLQFSSTAALVQDFTASRDRLRQAVFGLRTEGWTKLYDAIVRGLKHVQSGRHQRKALLVITDGNDTSSEIELQQAIDFALKSEVPIYSLGIGDGEQGTFGHTEGHFTDVVGVDALRGFSYLTGGRIFLLQGAHRKNGLDEIDQACQRVAAELRYQYTLGYYPNGPRKESGYRRIRVKVRGDDLKVRTRDGYIGSPTSTTRASRPE